MNLAPNGKPSNLTPEQYALVRTPAFKAWFGDWEKAYETGNYDNVSKVIDEVTKEPLVVYHGSKNDFYVFDQKRVGDNTHLFYNTKVFYFASNKETSQSPLYVNYKINSEEFKNFKKDIIKQHYENFSNLAKHFGVPEKKFYNDFWEEGKNQYSNNFLEELHSYGSLENFINETISDSVEFGRIGEVQSDYIKAINMMWLITIDKDYLYFWWIKNVNSANTKEEDDDIDNKIKEILNKLGIKDIIKKFEKKYYNLPLEKGSNIKSVFLKIIEPIQNDEHSEEHLLQETVSQIGAYEETDGAIIRDVSDGGLYKTDIYAVKNSNQIKLSDGTNTTFDSNNPDIRYAEGGSIPDLLSSQEVEYKLGRKLDWWNDDIVYLSGIEYKKVYLRPEYKRVF